MRKKIFRSVMVLSIMGTAFASKAQNLVPNPSFEAYTTCPSNNIFTAADWYNPNTASPDYFNPCGTGYTVPGTTALFGPQTARTGTSFAGTGWYGLGGGWYDYIQVQLISPLVAGQTYQVSMWVVLANGVTKASDDIGIYISNTPFKSTSTILPGISTIIPTTPANFGVFTTLTPQIKCADGNFITDTDNWTQISGLYTAVGGEQAITIGCFEPWASTGVLLVNPSGNERSYYHIDDVSVEQVISIPSQPGPINGLQTVCESSIQTFTVDSVQGATSYTWTLPNGWTGTSTGNSITVDVGASSGNITVTANNVSGSSTAQTLAVTVNTFPAQPGIVSGPLSVCTGSTRHYSISSVQGATSYYWTLPSGWSGMSTTTSIDVLVGQTGGMLIAHAQNECGTSGSQVEISVQNPDVSIVYSNGQLVSASSQDSYQWVNCEQSYALISGETQAIFTPAVTGNYAVAVNKNGCVDTSSCVQVTVTNSGVIENANLGITVYPNPVLQKMYITSENMAAFSHYFMYNMQGKPVFSGIINNDEKPVEVILPEGISDGIYLLILTGEKVSLHQKIVIKK